MTSPCPFVVVLLPGERPLDVADGELVVVEDRCGEHRIGAGIERLLQVLGASGTARGDHRHANDGRPTLFQPGERADHAAAALADRRRTADRLAARLPAACASIDRCVDEVVDRLWTAGEPLELRHPRLDVGPGALTLRLDLERRLEELSVRDPLTGCYNRRYLQAQQPVLERPTYFYGVLMMDLDNFKEINDTYGHEEGDRVLQRFSHFIIRNKRADDILVRLGGDEPWMREVAATNLGGIFLSLGRFFQSFFDSQLHVCRR